MKLIDENTPKDGTQLLLLLDYEPVCFVGYWGKEHDNPDSEETWRVSWDGTNITEGLGRPTHYELLPKIHVVLPKYGQNDGK